MSHFISEKVFLDKELCDAIRETAIDGAMRPEEASTILERSNDYKRDSFIIIKLSVAGYDYKQISCIIRILNY